MRFNLAFLWLFVSIFLGAVPTAEAATLYMDPPQSELNRGDSVVVSVRLDTDEIAGECVNAVDAVIAFPSNIVPVDVSLGESIFSIWVEEPTINVEEGTISFAGGIPNGYCGRVQGDPRLTNKLVNIIFRSPGFTVGSGAADEGVAEIKFNPETIAYLNDGQGTQANLTSYGTKILLNKTGGQGIINPWKEDVNNDNVLPEEFSIALSKDRVAFAGKYYISFNTQDKQTGIDHYEVMEQPLAEFGSFVWGRADAPWVVARSPYVLEDQSLNSIIRVKALDKAGNEYVATLIPDESLRTLSASELFTYLMIGVVLFLLIVIVVAIFAVIKLLKKRKKDKAALAGSTNDVALTTDSKPTV